MHHLNLHVNGDEFMNLIQHQQILGAKLDEIAREIHELFLREELAKKDDSGKPIYRIGSTGLFDGATSFIPGQEWRVDEVAQSLIASGKIEPPIIVGIYNASVERVNEYTAAQDPKYKAGGKADLYEWYI